MKYRVSSEERELIIKFQKSRIPSIFKTDGTDRLLFIEYMDFFVCNLLLKGKEISDSVFNEAIENHKRFCRETDVNEFDEYALEYFNLCMRIVEITKKYYKLSVKDQL